uniref:Uncharacterized protein n=1 Tax=Amphimedon queenslandica TaxID=400682 RepID=A0A1X7TJF5_AMPQE
MSSNEDKKRLRNERDRERRRNETPEEKKARRASRNEKDALRRAQRRLVGVPDPRLTRETVSQREERLAGNRARSQSIRDRERSPVREERLASNRARSRSLRDRETSPRGKQVLRENIAKQWTELGIMKGERGKQVLRENIAKQWTELGIMKGERGKQVLRENIAKQWTELGIMKGERGKQVLRENIAKQWTELGIMKGERGKQVLRENIAKQWTELGIMKGGRGRRLVSNMKPFHIVELHLHMIECSNIMRQCHQSSFSSARHSNGVSECNRCANDKRIPKLYSSGNNMDPGVVPTQLQGLTQAEEMLVSAIMPVMSIYRLPHGQYGYSGHVVNFPQDVKSFAIKLPRLSSEINVLVVRKEREQTHRDFRVRRRVVEEALAWLLANNIYYRSIGVSLDQGTLASLPEDGDLTDLCTIQPTESEASDGTTTTEEHFSSSFVPNAAPPATERETIQQAVQSLGQPQSSNLMWPSIGGTPINEFQTEGYFSMAFPTLFPTGTADFNGTRIFSVTVGNYFTHLMKYNDGRFAKHPRFRFFALNTEMRWRANETGRIYIRQHPGEAHLTVDDLRDMIGREGEVFANKVTHYGACLRGTRQYWFRERNRLIAMIDTLGLPTIFFTHSAADHQWPELASLICPEHPDDKQARAKAVVNNPALADWFFTYRIQRFVEVFYVGILGATDYWMRFEWQHRGSPHVHGLAWLPNAPNVENLLSSSPDLVESTKQEIIEYADKIISTINPAVLPDGSNVSDAPPAKVDPHICNKSFSQVTDFEEDLNDLIATCQRHTRCSESYCLRTRNGKQECRFGYPKDLQAQTTINITEEEPVILTARNDGMLNSFNPIQLTSWRANVDMQYIVSKNRVVQYCTKYVTKSETRSQSLKDIFANIARSLKDGNRSLKAVQKLLINTFGERDYSAQETCHLLLQLPMYKASRSFTNLSLDGSRGVENTAQEGERVTAHSVLDHYISRPSTTHFNSITLLDFTRQYTMPKELGTEPKKRSKEVPTMNSTAVSL